MSVRYGVMRVLAEAGALPQETPRLAELTAIFAGPPEPEQFTAEYDRLDQIGWPVRGDAELAYLALSFYPPLPDRLKARLLPGERWLSGDRAAEAELLGAWRALQAEWIVSLTSNPEQARAIFEKLHEGSEGGEDTSKEVLEAALRDGPCDPRAAYAAERAACAVRSAAEGWLAYYAHRRLPSIAAAASAEVIKVVAERAGAPLYQALVARAIELAAAARGVAVGQP